MFDASKPRTDEPFFTLLGRDIVAPQMIRAWAHWRCGNYELAMYEASRGLSVTMNMEPQNSSDPQIIAAFKMADDIEVYQRDMAIKKSASLK